MAGTLKVKSVQLGDNVTATQNFVWSENSDGTAKLARGNVGATTQDILTVNAVGAVALLGTTTNDSAAAGQVGEYFESVVPSGSGVSLVSTASKNVTSLTLTAGDWDVSGYVNFSFAGTTSVTFLAGAINTVTNTFPAVPDGFRLTTPAYVPGATVAGQAVATTRISIASTTTVYLIANAIFTVSTLTALGRISARRVR